MSAFGSILKYLLYLMELQLDQGDRYWEVLLHNFDSQSPVDITQYYNNHMLHPLTQVAVDHKPQATVHLEAG